MGHEAKWEYSRAVYERYRTANRKVKQLMLNEFCLNTGYHRKYAIRLLNGPPPGKQAERKSRGRRPHYGKQVLSILAAIWEAAGYPWSVRLRALLPSWMPWIRKRFQLNPGIEKRCVLSVALRKWGRFYAPASFARRRRKGARLRLRSSTEKASGSKWSPSHSSSSSCWSWSGSLIASSRL